MMTKKKMLFSTGLYIFCALIWTMNFFLHWHLEGRLLVSSLLYGVSAVCFTVAAVLNVMQLRRMRKQ